MLMHKKYPIWSSMPGVLSSALFIFLGIWCGTIQAEESNRPNILLIVSEDNGPELNEPVISTDLYPTILAATGQPPRPHQHVDGVDLSPILTQTGEIRRDAVYWHYSHYNRHPANFPSGAIRAGDWKLIESFETGELELYHLANDIGETVDLAQQQPEKLAEMHRMLKGWRSSVGAEAMQPNPQYESNSN